jgi:putative ABC transport system permease protein
VHARLLSLVLILPLAPGVVRAQGPGVAVERRLAETLNLRVGDTLRLASGPDSVGRLVSVAAIYEPPRDPAVLLKRELRLRMHLPDLAALLGAPDRIDRAGVALRPGVSADSAAARINLSAFGYRAAPSREIAAESSQTFAVVSRFHRAIAVITVVASAVFLLCIMLLKVEERRRDAAVMRFIGVRRRTIFGALLLEAAAIAIVGALLGIAIAWAAGALTNLYYQRYFATQVVFSLITPRIVLFGVVLSLVLGIGAGALAALRLVRTRPTVLWGRG